MLPRIAITAGEPAGIGPELVAALAATDLAADIIAIGDAHLLKSAAQARGLDLDFEDYLPSPIAQRKPGALRVLHVPLRVPAVPGKLDPRNGAYVIDTLARAADGCASGEFDALVTAPVQKSAIADAGIPFTGHTEFFAERAGRDVVMMLVAPDIGGRALPNPHADGGSLRVALATTHLPLKDVSAALTIDGLVETLVIIDRDLRRDFGLAAPRILVTGLNPHAGENGYLGREEIDVISPALARTQAQGIDARGPYPADTLFQPRHLEGADCVLAMFHDQGLPVLKYATFGEGINVTLGLPIIRTSVDHGTALDLAGTGRADPGSMVAALDTAVAMARHRRAS